MASISAAGGAFYLVVQRAKRIGRNILCGNGSYAVCGKDGLEMLSGIPVCVVDMRRSGYDIVLASVWYAGGKRKSVILSGTVGRILSVTAMLFCRKIRKGRLSCLLLLQPVFLCRWRRTEGVFDTYACLLWYTGDGAAAAA